jgi:glycosyltransferase involved in cell wall biosynthesis
MQIGMVTACYKPVLNGVTRMVVLYKKYLEAAGHEVTVFTLGEPDPAGEDPNVIRTAAIPLGDTGYYFNFRYSRAMQQKLREMEIIHCHHLLMSAEMAHRYGRAPIVYTNHTRYDLYTGNYIPLPQSAADAIMRQMWPDLTDNCDIVVTPSDSVREVMHSFGVRRPIEVIPNGIELDPFWYPAQPCTKSSLGLPEDVTLLAYVGRLSQEKNLELMLEQFKHAAAVTPKLHLMIVGRGPSADSLRRYVSELAISDSVTFIGAVPYEQVGDYLAAADAFITASVTEVHPLTVIEAMAARLPVVGVSSPGIKDTVTSGQTGVLAAEPAGLSAAIVSLAGNPTRRREMSEAAFEESRRYDIKNTVDQTVELYDRLRIERPDLKRSKDSLRARWRDRESLIEQLGGIIRKAEERLNQ